MACVSCYGFASLNQSENDLLFAVTDKDKENN